MKRLTAILTMCAFLLNAFPGLAQLFGGGSRSKTFSFEKLPTTVEELQALPEASLTDPYATVALCLAVLCNYEADVNETLAMLDVLRGPDPTSTYGKQFLQDPACAESTISRAPSSRVPSRRTTTRLPSPTPSR